MNDDFLLIEPGNEAEWEAYYRIRYEVLRAPWGQTFDSTKDEFERISLHLLLLDAEGKAAGAGRLQFNNERQGQIRSMAIREDLRGNGWGRKILERLEEEAVKAGLKEIILDAREPAVGFYLDAGYEITGDSYLLFGIIPHKAMKKLLTS
jgi:predicted GNAT family N-acyltransferase